MSELKKVKLDPVLDRYLDELWRVEKDDHEYEIAKEGGEFAVYHFDHTELESKSISVMSEVKYFPTFKQAEAYVLAVMKDEDSLIQLI